MLNYLQARSGKINGLKHLFNRFISAGIAQIQAPWLDLSSPSTATGRV
jgi:hypothetical protein